MIHCCLAIIIISVVADLHHHQPSLLVDCHLMSPHCAIVIVIILGCLFAIIHHHCHQMQLPLLLPLPSLSSTATIVIIHHCRHHHCIHKKGEGEGIAVPEKMQTIEFYFITTNKQTQRWLPI